MRKPEELRNRYYVMRDRISVDNIILSAVGYRDFYLAHYALYRTNGWTTREERKKGHKHIIRKGKNIPDIDLLIDRLNDQNNDHEKV